MHEFKREVVYILLEDNWRSLRNYSIWLISKSVIRDYRLVSKRTKLTLRN